RRRPHVARVGHVDRLVQRRVRRRRPTHAEENTDSGDAECCCDSFRHKHPLAYFVTLKEREATSPVSNPCDARAYNVCAPTPGVGSARLQEVPSRRAGTGLANDGSSSETCTDWLKLAVHDGMSTHDLPELPMKPLNAYGPSTWTRRSMPLRSSRSRALFGWTVNGTG